MTKLSEYQGKLAMVTGAGDGIGEMLAKQLAAAGLTVAVQDIRQDAAERVVSEIGGSAFPIVFDVSDRDACLAAADALRAHGPLNLLWINAGVGVGSPILTGKPNAIEWALGVNVYGVIWTAQAFTPLMQDAEGPRHVGFTASTAALRSPAGRIPALCHHQTCHLRFCRCLKRRTRGPRHCLDHSLPGASEHENLGWRTRPARALWRP